MPSTAVVTLALRNLFRQKLRAALTLAAIATGVAALILAAGFVEDTLIQLRESVIRSQLGHLQVYRAGFSVSSAGNPYEFMIDDVGAAIRLIRSAPHVDAALKRLSFPGLISNGRADRGAFIEGVEPSAEEELGTAITIIAGRPLKDADLDGVLVGEGLANALKVVPGDALTILASARQGALNSAELRIVGVFRSYSREFDAATVRVPLGVAQEIAATDAVSAIVVSLDDTANTALAHHWLQPRLGAIRLEVRTWQELAEFYQATEALYERQFAVLRFIILVLVVFGVASSVNMSAFERTGEFGTMMAVGATRRAVAGLLLLENMFLGMIGSAAGAVGGSAVAMAVSAVGIPMPPPPNASVGYTAYIRIVPAELAVSFAIGVCAVMLAAILPAIRVPRLPIVDALRRNI